jgi:alkanesulfonate monooxygenase SsuD/methylene tetrahydromethanopterin reductase-like flavin-dependent oxidoreductase (luciferase family)
MRFGVAIPAYGQSADGAVVRDLIAAAEALGFESAWWPDHIAVPDYATTVNLSPPFLEPLAACGWGLGATARLRFGTDVLVAPYRNPLLVAAMVGTFARLAGDRLVLGVGIGYLRGEFDVLGLDSYERRAEVTEEFIRAMRQTPDDFHVVSAPSPVPIWVGGNSRGARRRAALLGDGWHPLWMPATDYRAARDEIMAVRAAEGRRTPFTFSYSCGATRLLDADPGGWGPPPARAPEGSEFRYAPAAWTTTEGRPRLVGTPDQMTADLNLLADAGVEHVVLRFGHESAGQLERFAKEVAPAFTS